MREGEGGRREGNGLGRMEPGEEGESPAEKNTAEERGIMKHLNSRKECSARVKVGCGEFAKNNLPTFCSLFSRGGDESHMPCFINRATELRSASERPCSFFSQSHISDVQEQ